MWALYRLKANRLKKETDLSMSGWACWAKSAGGYPGMAPTLRSRVFLVVVSLDEGRPGVGAGVSRGGGSYVAEGIRRRFKDSDSGGCPCCNALRRNSRAVDDWAGGVTEATFDEGAL